MRNREGSTAPAGLTLVEVVIASLIASFVAGGTMMAFVAAARMTASQDLMTHAEASARAQETIERYRDEVVANPTWLMSKAGAGWISEPLSGGGGTESKLNTGAKRCYRVTDEDCDGVGGAGDCYAVQSRVCWNDVSNCPC